MEQDKYTIANAINGTEYRNPWPKEILELAKDRKMVIVHAASDDLVEFDGAIYDEFSEGQKIYLTADGISVNECEAGDECPNFEQHAKYWIRGEFGKAGAAATWTFDSNIPNKVFFVIQEDGEPFIQGFVFCLEDLRCVG